MFTNDSSTRKTQTGQPWPCVRENQCLWSETSIKKGCKGRESPQIASEKSEIPRGGASRQRRAAVYGQRGSEGEAASSQQEARSLLAMEMAMETLPWLIYISVLKPGYFTRVCNPWMEGRVV